MIQSRHDDTHDRNVSFHSFKARNASLNEVVYRIAAMPAAARAARAMPVSRAATPLVDWAAPPAVLEAEPAPDSVGAAEAVLGPEPEPEESPPAVQTLAMLV